MSDHSNFASRPAQRGSLHLRRYPGQSILIYPKHQSRNVVTGELFAEPIAIIVEGIDENEAVHTRVVADKRLVVVRDEIYSRNGNRFTPAPARREEAYRRAFVEIAKLLLDEHQFADVSRQAWQRVLESHQEENQVEWTD